MLKLNASYSKKVPAGEEYSSQSFHASVEVELPDGLTQDQLQARIHETFDLVRNSVEAELHGNVPRNHEGYPAAEERKTAPQGNRTAERQAIPSCDILTVWNEFKHPRHEEFAEPTRWSLLNAFTETAKKYSPARADQCYRSLTRLFGLDGQPAELWNK